MFTLYRSDIIGNASNCKYRHRIEVNTAEDLADAVSKDYVCASYKNNYRQSDNFLGADCLPLDCDNDGSEDDLDWVTPREIAEAFPGVTFAVHYSRNHMKEKNSRAARPKFHVLFPISFTKSAEEYKEMKERVYRMFPVFDNNAMDASRFFYGTAEPNVEIIQGTQTLSEYLEDLDLKAFEDKVSELQKWDPVIEEGSRNSTLSKSAAVLLKKYGIQIPKDRKIMMAGCYKAVQGCTDIPEEVKDIAFKKCVALGFSPLFNPEGHPEQLN